MKRLRHWLFNFAAAVSLVICVATAVLWVRSYRHLNCIHVLMSTPTLMPIISEVQRAAWERLRQTQGGAGVYNSQYFTTTGGAGSSIEQTTGGKIEHELVLLLEGAVIRI